MSSGVNKVILVGNLGRDPEIQSFDGVKKASFSLATSESYKDKNNQKVVQTEWHNIVMWRGLAEVAEKYLHRGDTIYLEGKIKTRVYEENGNKRYFTDIIADSMTMLSGKRDDEKHVSNEQPGTSEQSGTTEEESGLPF
ncbi:MAG TPA: single-stranded DNA-binding protein [Bacteroidales bacterium]|nr:MAG: hypothetical protein A2X11_00090 [Bacteroidetes bacterium GWE2_42_24]OFY27797.1 MAG: hypothetical protein A2X09_02810 [Bacteroidetes bacterium GWF2_43_11]HAQ64876.1 single-stranded DNA-binding protein [Bacteroidales bacterium]HBZ66158.1 single-stranded DNA-binding protein [Bacteroidales bacterium]